MDLLTAPYLRGSLIRAIGDPTKPQVLLDLSRVTFIDGTGWDPVAAAGVILAERADSLMIVAASARVRRLMGALKIGPGIQVQDSNGKGAWGRISAPPEEVRGCYYLG